MTKCSICRAYAVARFLTPYGCVALPYACEMDLCAQHIVTDGMFRGTAEIKVIRIYNEELAAKMCISVEL